MLREREILMEMEVLRVLRTAAGDLKANDRRHA
jgi:hypothetical protein